MGNHHFKGPHGHPQLVMKTAKENTENLTDHGSRMPRSDRSVRIGIVRTCQLPTCEILASTHLLKTTKNPIKFGTRNVTRMFESVKIHNLFQEMSRLELDILGISEARWTNSRQHHSIYWSIYFSGNNEPHHSNGVAVMFTV